MKLKGSETEKNLKAAFAGESEARNKYTFFAKAAKNEGYEQIAEIFEKTAENEMEHAKIIFKALGYYSSTEENLISAAKDEEYENKVLYQKFADTAENEGFDQIAYLFRALAKVEALHEERYKEILSNFKNEMIFKKENQKTVWECRKCGHVHVGSTAPNVCPICGHSQNYFQIRCKNY